MKILHVTGYMAEAGIGKAISGLVLNETVHEHTILCLEYSQKRREAEKCIRQGIRVLEQPDYEKITEEISISDVVIVHWWHYPPMAEFLANFPAVLCRAVLWSHVSGCTYPFLPYDFLNCFQRILFTSPYAYENLLWGDEGLAHIEEKSGIVYGLSDICPAKVKTGYDKNKDGFTLIYVGSFTESKLYPGFAEVCQEIIQEIPESRFVMVGEDGTASWVKEKISRLQIEDHFKWTGFIDDVYQAMIESDVFFYPLNPFHFGTTENVILEAMAVGLPIVAFDQAAEKYIIKGRQTGMLADTKDDFRKILKDLYQEERLREDLGRRARESFSVQFKIRENITRFDEQVSQCMKRPKQVHSFSHIIGTKPWEWFLSAMRPEDREMFLKQQTKKLVCCQPIFREKTKSSIFHFQKYFPSDNYLQNWSRAMEESASKIGAKFGENVEK